MGIIQFVSIVVNVHLFVHSIPLMNVLKLMKLRAAIADPNKIVVFQTAPAVRVGLGEEFGLDAGTFVEGKMVAALRKLGGDYIFRYKLWC